jgi:protein-disulfide isomerase
MAISSRSGLAFALALALLCTLAGCASEGPSLLAASANPGATGTTLSLSPEEVAQSGPAVPFTPFGDPTASAVGGREVIANPTEAEILEPAGMPDMAFGRPDAPVTIVEYASLTCPYCKRFHTEVFPVLKREYIDTGKVRFILREFPIGRTSGQASVALRCASPDKYLDLYGRYLAKQPMWVSQEVRIEPIYAVAAEAGLTRAEFDSCRTNVAHVESLKATKDRGRKLGIIGTPNFFIGGKLVKKAIDLAELRAMIDPLVAARSAQASAAKP